MITDQQKRGLQRRGKKFQGLLAQLESGTSSDRKKFQTELESLQAEVNVASKVIPSLNPDEKKQKISELRPISNRIAELKKTIEAAGPALKIPNPPAPDVPEGDDESANIVEREVGKKPTPKNAQDYLTIAEAHGWVDMARGSKVSGSRFGYLVGPLAQMEFALVQYAQSVLLKEKFTLVVPPVLIKEENMSAMGYLDGGGEDEVYHFPKDKLYLVGTAEQAIGPMHRDETLPEQDLPKRYLAFSTSFRREAGSYGKDTKGIIRVHQFDKLEMFSLTVPEKSDEEHEFMLAMEEKLMQGLQLPYRVVKLATGDLGWPSARTYDIEAWLPGQNRYLETHSTSTTTDYQSRDLRIKVKRADGTKEFVHLLNGTAFAIGRTLVAIIENYQQADGSVQVPKVLQAYMGKVKVMGRR